MVVFPTGRWDDILYLMISGFFWSQQILPPSYVQEFKASCTPRALGTPLGKVKAMGSCPQRGAVAMQEAMNFEGI